MTGFPTSTDMLLAAGLLLAPALSGPAAAAAQEEIKLGCILSLTGPEAVLGRTNQMALEDHVKAVNAKGGIKGRKIRLIVYDDQSSYEEAMTFGARLMDQDHVAGIIGNGMAHSAVWLAPHCASAKVPFISWSTYSGVTREGSGPPRPYTFRVSLTIPAQAAALADYAFHELGKRRAAILYDINTYPGMEFSTRFETEFSRLGGKVVANANYTEGVTTDFQTQLARVGPANPDCILVPYGSSRQLALMARQARAAGFRIPLLGGGDWAVNELPRLGGKDVEGAVFITGLTTGDPRFADYNARFLMAHGTPCETSAYQALDAAMALEHAARVSLERTGKITPSAMNGALEHMKDVALFTGKLTMDPGTHSPRHLPVLVMTVEDGRQKLLKTCQVK